MFEEKTFNDWCSATYFGLSLHDININNVKDYVNKVKMYYSDYLTVVYIDNDWAFTVTTIIDPKNITNILYMIRYKI